MKKLPKSTKHVPKPLAEELAEQLFGPLKKKPAPKRKKIELVVTPTELAHEAVVRRLPLDGFRQRARPVDGGRERQTRRG